MAALNLRNVTSEQIGRWKKLALESGQTLQDWAVAQLELPKAKVIARTVPSEAKEKRPPRPGGEPSGQPKPTFAAVAQALEDVKPVHAYERPKGHPARCACQPCQFWVKYGGAS